MFNHPAGIASDGERLVLADRNNNRVLVWTTPPTGDTPADLVLGQPDLTRNAPGTGLGQMSWPTAVSAAGGRLAVADTENHRLLLWDRFPTRSGQPADRAIAYAALSRASGGGNYLWPWGVWTDGTRPTPTGSTPCRSSRGTTRSRGGPWRWRAIAWPWSGSAPHSPARRRRPSSTAGSAAWRSSACAAWRWTTATSTWPTRWPARCTAGAASRRQPTIPRSRSTSARPSRASRATGGTWWW